MNEVLTAVLNSNVRHYARVRRDGQFVQREVTHFVPCDLATMSLGEVVRLKDVHGLECNESVLTGNQYPLRSASAARNKRPNNRFE